MTSGGAIAIALAGLSALAAMEQTSAPSEQDAMANVAADFMAGDDWRMRLWRAFDPRSAALTLQVPAELKGAKLGYFDDGVTLAQLAPQKLRRMRADGVGFRAQADLDRDGHQEIYRTGFWEAGGQTGTFLVVFEDGQQKDFTVTPADAQFLRSERGQVTLLNYDWTTGTGQVRFRGDRLTLAWQLPNSM